MSKPIKNSSHRFNPAELATNSKLRAIRDAKNARTKARNAARKEAMENGVSRRDAVRMNF